MEVVMNVCDLITVVSYGEKLAEGTPQERRNDCAVIEAYLGKRRLELLLEIKDLWVHYGRAEALRGISTQVREGSIVTLLGANGAGKTTTLRTVSGLKKASSGEIWYEGQRIDTLPPR